MYLSDEAIREYQAIYKREFGTDISTEEAQIQGERLLEVFKVILKPIPDKKK